MAKKKKSVKKKEPKAKPRREGTRYIFAHDWEILRDERIPRWPSLTDARRIKVSITSWIGTCAIDAKHVSVRVEEEHNQWWCEHEDAWVELTCDIRNRGYSFNADVMTQLEAREYADFCVKLLLRNTKQLYLVDSYNEEDAELVEPDSRGAVE